MHGARRNVAPFTRAIRVALAVHRQRHLSTQNDVRAFRGMRVIRIGRVWPILPNIGMAEALSLQISRKFLLVHNMILPNTRQLPPKNGYALPAALGDAAERVLPSSGEKIVYKFKPLVEAAEHQARRLADRRETHVHAVGRPVRSLSLCNPQAP